MVQLYVKIHMLTKHVEATSKLNIYEYYKIVFRFLLFYVTLVRTGCGISVTTVWYLYIIASPISLRYDFIQQQKEIYEEQKEIYECKFCLGLHRNPDLAIKSYQIVAANITCHFGLCGPSSTALIYFPSLDSQLLFLLFSPHLPVPVTKFVIPNTAWFVCLEMNLDFKTTGKIRWCLLNFPAIY